VLRDHVTSNFGLGGSTALGNSGGGGGGGSSMYGRGGKGANAIDTGFPTNTGLPGGLGAGGGGGAGAFNLDGSNGGNGGNGYVQLLLRTSP
jgi:hypothetical protein